MMKETMIRLYQAAKQIKKVEAPSELAVLLGESPQTINNWESRGVSKSGMIKAEEVIGCSVNWLKTGEGPMLVAQKITDKTQATINEVISECQRLIAEKNKPISDEKRAWIYRSAINYQFDFKLNQQELEEFIKKALER